MYRGHRFRGRGRRIRGGGHFGSALVSRARLREIERMLRAISTYRMLYCSSYLLVAIQFAMGCSSFCNRDGCNALKNKAEQSGAGVAGIIAGESDAVTNGCSDCDFSSALIEIWATESAPTDDQARDITQAETPSVVLSSDRAFTQQLDPGHYLFCVRPSCVPIQVVDRTVTVNVKRREGPPSFFTESTPGSALAETFGVEVGHN